MARRKIGATIALDGEKQFRQAVTECSRALTNMRSEMRLVLGIRMKTDLF